MTFDVNFSVDLNLYHLMIGGSLLYFFIALIVGRWGYRTSRDHWKTPNAPAFDGVMVGLFWPFTLTALLIIGLFQFLEFLVSAGQKPKD